MNVTPHPRRVNRSLLVFLKPEITPSVTYPQANTQALTSGSFRPTHQAGGRAWRVPPLCHAPDLRCRESAGDRQAAPAKAEHRMAEPANNFGSVERARGSSRQ